MLTSKKVEMPNEQALLDATVEHKTFDDLLDVITLGEKDLDKFVEETLQMSQIDNDEEWRPQYDAILNLRILNKFHFAVIQQSIDKYGTFISKQAMNLRSNNSRNSLELFKELFSKNGDKCQNGLKIDDNWVALIETTLQTILNKCVADKQFLARVAQQGVLACAKSSPISQTTQIITQGCNQKAIKLQEFSAEALSAHVVNAPDEFLMAPQNESNTLDMLQTFIELREKKQARLVKHCDPALKHLQEKMGKDQLKDKAVKALLRKVQSQEEESKEEPSEEQKKNLKAIETRVGLVIDALNPKKKAAAKPNLKSFMQTQKNDLKQMVLPANKDEVLVGGFSGTVQLPKNQPLITSEPSKILSSAGGTPAEELTQGTPQEAESPSVPSDQQFDREENEEMKQQ